jgi:hypothetical protein
MGVAAGNRLKAVHDLRRGNDRIDRKMRHRRMAAPPVPSLIAAGPAASSCAMRYMLGPEVADSPLEEAVTSEPVSELGDFPASWENTGNFIGSRQSRASITEKCLARSYSYGPIPYAAQQGILCSRSGNSNR